LLDPNYEHRFYVDASPTVADVYLNDRRQLSRNAGSWKSVLVGGLGAGGRVIYALDVTNPKLFSEAYGVLSL
jgi:type IV pilus assembly protein PilY1